MAVRRAFCLVALASVGVFAGACSASSSTADDAVTNGDNNLNEAPTPRKGSTIQSPSVDPMKMYWGARSINILTQIGYLTNDEAALANRADGILANSPPNGKIGVDELAALESPAHINTLFPAEKAVIPKLWKILVVDDVTSYTPSAAAIPATPHDAYPTAHFQMPIAKVSLGNQQLANRIELTQNNDSDTTTISGNDIEKAFADSGSYLPQEIAQFHAIALEIATASPQLKSDAQYVDVPASSQQLLLDVSPVKLFANMAMSVASSWSGNFAVQPTLSAAESLSLTDTDVTARIVLLDKISGADAIVQAGSGANIGAATRVEVWKGGARAAEFDAVPSSSGTASASFPFGYAVKIGAQESTLDCWGQTRTCTYVTPGQGTVSIPATSYYFAGHPDYRLDVFQNGRALLVSNGGATSETCYPTPGIYNNHQVPECRTFNKANGQATGVITFGNQNVNTPFVATAQFSAPSPLAGSGIGLYPY